jgi:NitT/TauT family transport system ATP-binding protein
MAIDPKLLLLDEPFAALDAQTKIVLQEEFVRLWESARRTVMLVTHDIAEAVAMADRVIVFSHRPGRIVADIAIDLPRPRDIEAIRFDARFIDLARSIWLHLTGKAQS